MPIVKLCEECGKNYECPPSYSATRCDGRRFCGRACAGIARTKRALSGACLTCGATISHRRKFCSQACFAPRRFADKTQICARCGTPFAPHKQHKKYCSHDCYWKHRAATARLDPLPPNVDGASWIPLGNGSFALVDEADATMFADAVSYVSAGGYAYVLTGNGKKVPMHRLIMRAPAEFDVDHVDGNPLNNRRSNLRLVTAQENGFNSVKQSRSARGNLTSQYKGVRAIGNGSWCAVVGSRWVGSYRSELDAARAYDESVRQIRGQLGRYNFPRPGEQSALSRASFAESAS